MWLTWLKSAALRTGYPVTEIAGWQTRGHGQMVEAVGVVGHDTVGAATGDLPSLNVLVNGRRDLPGPLCNLGLGRTGRIWVIAAGVGYHAGESSWAGFTELNDKFVGIEAESVGNGKDWTPAQLDCYPKLVGSLLDQMSVGVDRYCSHRSCAVPAGRKIDPTGLTDAWMRAGAQAFMDGLEPPVPPPGPLTLPTLTYGQTSIPVHRLQMFMTHMFPSYNAYSPTGFYGDLTAAGLKEFQRRVGIISDGHTVGPQTNAKLWSFGYRG